MDGMTNRISHLFEEGSPLEGAYVLACQVAWDGMEDKLHDVFWGPIAHIPTEEDFHFKPFDSRLN
mgnify:CR=1 FL=1